MKVKNDIKYNVSDNCVSLLSNVERKRVNKNLHESRKALPKRSKTENTMLKFARFAKVQKKIKYCDNTESTAFNRAYIVSNIRNFDYFGAIECSKRAHRQRSFMVNKENYKTKKIV